jgi:hypothetical protein
MTHRVILFRGRSMQLIRTTFNRRSALRAIGEMKNACATRGDLQCCHLDGKTGLISYGTPGSAGEVLR